MYLDDGKKKINIKSSVKNELKREEYHDNKSKKQSEKEQIDMSDEISK